MGKSQEIEAWSKVLDNRVEWFSFDYKAIWAYRDLILLLVRRDFTAIYKQTILGPLWHVIQPVLTSLMYMTVFGMVARISTDGVPKILFYMSGVVFWNYFSNCLNSTSNTFVSNAAIFSKVYFPRLCVPISSLIANLISLSIQMSVFFIILAFYWWRGMIFNLHPSALLFPLLILQTALLGLGLGCLISSMTTKYRDLGMVMGFMTQLMMYATPIVYPLSEVSRHVPSNFQWFWHINPMTSVIETMRYSFLGQGTFDVNLVLMSWLITAGIFVAGLIAFHRVEKSFVDTV